MPDQLRPRPFVGRREELAALTAARRALAQSRGSIVLIRGDAGIGKSRLLAQFLLHSGDRRDRNVFRTECMERAQQPFGPVRTLIRSITATAPPRRSAPEVERVLARFRMEGPPGQGAVDEPIRPPEKAELFGALLEMLKLACSSRATILTIEDLHWADTATLEFLSYLAPRIARLRFLLVTTFRSGEAENEVAFLETLSRLAREPASIDLPLQPLSAEQIHEFIAASVPAGHALNPATVREIVERSEGNPFFIEELLKSAVNSERPNEREALPLSIRSAVLRRLATLTDDERSVLSYAAVLGPRFDIELLARVMKREVDAVLPAIRRARTANLIVDDERAKTGCRFRHDLTRQTILREMLRYDAHRVHLQTLDVLETFAGEDGSLEQLAYHAAQSGDPVRTRLYNRRAGEAALAVGALSEARRYFECALAVADNESEDVELREHIAEVLVMQGESRAAVTAYETLLSVRLAHEELDEAARVVVKIAGEESNSGTEARVCIARCTAFLATFGERLSLGAADHVRVFAARIASAVNDFSTVECLLRDVQVANLPPRVAQNYYLSLLNLSADAGDCVAFTETAHRLMTMLPDVPPFVAMIAYYTVAQLAIPLGLHPDVEKALQHAAALRRRGDFGGITVFGDAIVAAHDVRRGRLEESRLAIERVLRQPEVVVAQRAASETVGFLAEACGDDEIAEHAFSTETLDAAIESGLLVDAARSAGARAVWNASRGRLRETQGAVARILPMLERASPACGPFLIAAALYAADSDLEHVIALAHPERRLPQDASGRACGLLALAVVAQRRGNRMEAVAQAGVAAEAFATLGWPLFEARALEVAGRMDEARKLYDACGATRQSMRLGGSVASRERRPTISVLSAREREIAELVTRGLSNPAIAETLAVSIKTVEKHLSSVFSKIGVSSRAQVAAFIAAQSADAESASR